MAVAIAMAGGGLQIGNRSKPQTAEQKRISEEEQKQRKEEEARIDAEWTEKRAPIFKRVETIHTNVKEIIKTELRKNNLAKLKMKDPIAELTQKEKESIFLKLESEFMDSEHDSNPTVLTLTTSLNHPYNDVKVDSVIRMNQFENINWKKNEDRFTLMFNSKGETKVTPKKQEMINKIVSITIPLISIFNAMEAWTHTIELGDYYAIEVNSSSGLKTRNTVVSPQKNALFSVTTRGKISENLSFAQLKSHIETYLTQPQNIFFTRFTAQCQRVTLLLEKMERRNSNAYLSG
jgi:hypothetical protein